MSNSDPDLDDFVDDEENICPDCRIGLLVMCDQPIPGDPKAVDDLAQTYKRVFGKDLPESKIAKMSASTTCCGFYCDHCGMVVARHDPLCPTLQVLN